MTDTAPPEAPPADKPATPAADGATYVTEPDQESGGLAGINDPVEDDVRRTVSAHIEADVQEVAEVVFSVATAEHTRSAGSGGITEDLSITIDGNPLAYDEVISTHGTRLQLVRGIPAGRLVLDYRATITGEPATPPIDANQDAADRILYLRPSRYAESDTLAAVAGAQFQGLAGKELLDAVSSWVGQRLAYVSGSSRATDGAVQTYLARQGVCRDFAHLTVALLRACGVPARLVAVYAPGLDPMDFHAVAEAFVEGGWYIVDSTALAPRRSMLRIATGRDASDTAFMTVQAGVVAFSSVRVTATISPRLPEDDLTKLVYLA